MKKILVIHGPNLNLLGEREPEVYGNQTLNEVNQIIYEKAKSFSLDSEFFQSNHEGVIIDILQDKRKDIDGIIINPAALTHYSIALRDCLSAIAVPFVEVHLSDISKREEFRRHSVLKDICLEQISGYGVDSYLMALDKLVEYLKLEKK